MNDLVVLGAGAHAREVAEAARATGRYGVVAFVVDPGFVTSATVAGAPVVDEFHRVPRNSGSALEFVAGVGSPSLRRRLVERAERAGLSPATVVHPSVQCMGRSEIGPGVVVFAGAVLTCDVVLGPHVHVNVGATLSHDVVVGAFSTIAPGATICGRVAIGEATWVGAGATVIEDVRVGRRALVAAGAVVVADVADDTVVAGVPARLLRRNAPDADGAGAA